MSTKAIALHKARKRSYQFAVQDAFGKIVLAVLPNGKVYADVNTTVEERVNLDEDLETDSLIKVRVNHLYKSYSNFPLQ